MVFHRCCPASYMRERMKEKDKFFEGKQTRSLFAYEEAKKINSNRSRNKETESELQSEVDLLNC